MKKPNVYLVIHTYTIPNYTGMDEHAEEILSIHTEKRKANSSIKKLDDSKFAKSCRVDVWEIDKLSFPHIYKTLPVKSKKKKRKSNETCNVCEMIMQDCHCHDGNHRGLL